MRLALPISAAVLILSGCAAGIQTQASTSYASDDFSTASLAEGGLAILPVTAGDGLEGFRRPFGDALNTKLDSAGSMRGISVTRWQDAMRMVNDADLTSDYNDAVVSYGTTSIIDARLLNRLGEATGARYLLYVVLGGFDQDSELRVNALTGNLDSFDSEGTAAFAQVWDTDTGDVVWEGAGSSRAQGSELAYVEPKSPAEYSRFIAAALAEEIMGE